MRSLFAVVCAITFLAGCLSTDTPPEGAIDDPTPAHLAPVLVCPPGPSLERTPGVCVTTIARPGQSFTEPKLSIQPNDANRLVLGVNAGNTAVLDPASLTPLDPSPFRSEIFLSTDAGATWRHLRPPVPLAEGARYGSADTDAILDEDGTIHLTALSITARPDNSFALHLFHTASQDDGATWSTPTLFFDDGLDNRNWNTIAPDNALVVAWDRPDSAEVAWSRDDGTTWERLTIEGCTNPRPVVYADDVPLLACRNDEGARLEVHRLDLENGTSALRAPLFDAHPFGFSRGGDGALWLGVWAGEILFLRSTDDGATWQEHVALADIPGVPGDPLAVRALAADPWGNLHLILEALRGPCQDVLPLNVRGACPSEAAFGGSVHHLMLAPTGEAGNLTKLTPDEMRSPPPLAVASWDDYHGIDFTGDHGYLVWTYDKGLDITRVAP